MRHLLPPLIALALVPMLALAQTPPPAAPPQPAAQTAPATPANPGLYPRVKLETSLGNIVVELNGEKAPISTQNFIRYAEEGFYNGTIFHRVMKTFMIQGGGFTPDLTQKREGLHEPIKNEWQNGLKNERGTIAMARTGEPDSATAQFFINVVNNGKGAQSDLDTPRPSPKGPAAYAVFGRVVEGMDVVDKIKDVPVQTSSKYPSPQPVVPVEPVVIKSVTLISEYDRAKVDQLAGEQVKKAQEEQAKAEQEKEKAVQELVAKVEAETGKKLQKTPTGLMYVMLAEGEGAAPKNGESVSMLFTASLPDGKVWDSATDRSKPHMRPLNPRETLPGLVEGLALMKPGGKAKFIIPPELGYGPRGRVDKGIAPNSTLIFDVELLGVQSAEQMKAAGEKQLQDFIAKTEAETGKKFEKTASGLMYLKLTEGKGPAVTPTSKIQAHYTGWLVDGTKFDSSVDRAQPIPVDIAKGGVIPGWIEGLKLMKLGDKWKFVIPPNLAYGDRGSGPIPPNSTLVFDIEVVDVK
jgi:FKBP-type peptidyl-prolyl cis-trans isomerase/cyclophilin family peptidyl-prolyl cis-trans isomerase